MLLDIDNVIPYALRRGLLSAADVIEGQVRARSASRRNRNFRITREGGGGLLVKQAESEGARVTLRAEAGLYELVFREEQAAPMRPFLPRLVGSVPEDALLALELIEDAAPLHQFTGEFRSRGFLSELGAILGQALGTFHRCLRSLAHEPRIARSLGRSAPWVLWVHRPGPEILAELSSGNRKTLQILQQDPDLSRHLDALRRSWTPDTFIHCDIKADNLLISHATPRKVHIVDWELIQLGDPAWDLGAVFKDFLVYWITSMPVAKGMSGSDMAARAALPLALFQEASRRLWPAYCQAAELAGDAADAMLQRTVRSAAAWLVQYAYESAQRASSLGNHEVMMLQVGANIFADPAGATQHLLGILQRSKP
ncbi:MAG: phosphotransferase [Polyangia bacterium]